MHLIKDTSFTAKVSKFLEATHNLVARESGVETTLIEGHPRQILFTVHGEPVFASDLGYKHGLLPLFAWKADKIQESVSGYQFGFGYRPNENSFTRYEVNLDPTTEAHSEALLFVLEGFDECRRLLPRDATYPNAVELGSLLNDFSLDMAERFSADPNQRPSMRR